MGQQDALEIESLAKRRLADEYDAAQDRGEVRANGERTFSSPEKVGPSDIGLAPKEIHDARLIRDAKVADPGETRRALDGKIERGEEPTKGASKGYPYLQQSRSPERRWSRQS